MRVLVEYHDGSQKVELDDGREVIISAPYSDGSRRIDGDDGSSGWLTDKYSDGSRRATLNDGTVYSVDDRNTYFSGKQETWEKTRSGSGNSGGASSGSGELFIGFLLMFGGLIVGLIGMAIVTIPIIAPILLVVIEQARKRGDVSEVKKLEGWGSLAGILAVFVVFIIASGLGVGAFLLLTSALAQTSLSSTLMTLVYVFAFVLTIITFVLSFVTGIAPTAIVYLRHKAAQAYTSGNTTRSTSLNRFVWAIGIIAAGTVFIVLIGIVVLIVYAMFAK